MVFPVATCSSVKCHMHCVQPDSELVPVSKEQAYRQAYPASGLQLDTYATGSVAVR